MTTLVRWLASISGFLLAIGCAQPLGASASYAGQNGAIVYQLSGGWDAGNLGSCDICSGSLSGIYRFNSGAAAKPMDRCLYATEPLGLCGAGVPLVQCLFSTPPDEICDVRHPSFSPDGRELVYASTGATACTDYSSCDPPTGAPDKLVLANADGTDSRMLPAFTASDIEPAFLPSGTGLVFAGQPSAAAAQTSYARPKATTDLFTVTAAGSGLRRITFSGASQPAPCSIGSIAYVHAGNIYLLSRDGRTERRLTVMGGQRPDCSPNGRHIAFVRGGELYLVRVRDDRVSRLTTSGGVRSGPAFAPDGRELAFTISQSTHSDAAECQLGATSIQYLEFVNLAGRRQGPLRRIADDGIDDGDCGGHTIFPGTITWQARTRG